MNSNKKRRIVDNEDPFATFHSVSPRGAAASPIIFSPYHDAQVARGIIDSCLYENPDLDPLPFEVANVGVGVSLTDLGDEDKGPGFSFPSGLPHSIIPLPNNSLPAPPPQQPLPGMVSQSQRSERSLLGSHWQHSIGGLNVTGAPTYHHLMLPTDRNTKGSIPVGPGQPSLQVGDIDKGSRWQRWQQLLGVGNVAGVPNHQLMLQTDPSVDEVLPSAGPPTASVTAPAAPPSVEPDLGSDGQQSIHVGGIASAPTRSTGASAPPRLIFGSTPFGTYCKECNASLACTPRAYSKHVTDHHKDLLLGEIQIDFGKLAQDAGINYASLKLVGNYKEYIIGFGAPVNGHTCKRCDKTSTRRQNITRHVLQPGLCSASDILHGVSVYQTICGRWVTASFVHKSQLPPGAKVPYAKTLAWLEQHVSNDEDPAKYLHMFHPIDPDDKKISTLVQFWSLPPTGDDHLVRLLAEVPEWIVRARIETKMVPANFRAAMQVFFGQDKDGVTINHTFTFRHENHTLEKELKKFLCFLLRFSRQSGTGKTMKQFLTTLTHCPADHPFLIPMLLQPFLIENPETLFDTPVVVQYCLSRAFRVNKHDGSLMMIKCDQLSSVLATVISFLKAGVCSYLCTIRSNVQEVGSSLVQEVRFSRVVNVLSPFIRKLKEMKDEKGTTRMKSVSREGHVTVDGFTFSHEIWSLLIPLVTNKCVGFLGELLVGQDWLQVLDTSLPIFVNKVADSFRVEFQVGHPGRPELLLSSDQIGVKPELNGVVFDRLVAYLSLAFFGLSGGVMRGTEVAKLSFFMWTWHRTTAYFTATVLKTGSFQCHSRVNTVEHKLPDGLARVFLLFRLVAQSRNGKDDGLDLRTLLSVRTPATRYLLSNAIAELFNLHSPPSLTQVRQFFASISNFVCPDSNSKGLLTADAGVAQMSGHSTQTHKNSYGTILLDGRETVYRVLELAFGYDATSTASQQTRDQAIPIPLTREELLIGLQGVVNSTALWNCPKQELMVALAAADPGRHAHVSLPCGSGKSTSWSVPHVADFYAKKVAKTTFVIGPYIFLLQYHHNSAEKIPVLRTMIFTAADIQENKLPACLQDPKLLPHVIFLTLEAACNFFTFFGPTVQEWARRRLIKRIVIDEIHTLFTEQKFRPSYEFLPLLVQYGIPVMTMSGSLPTSLVANLLEHMEMCTMQSRQDVDVIDSGDLLGEFPLGFSMTVTESPFAQAQGMAKVKGILSSNSEHGSIHIIAGTKTQANDAFSTLTGDDHDCRLVTGDSTASHQALVAQQWSASFFRVLVSTTVALVGNENTACRHVVVIGSLYNLLNIVQALGRLRPWQREGGASFSVYIPSITDFFLKNIQEELIIDLTALKCRKLLREGEDQLFYRLLTIHGLKDWVRSDGCRVRQLAHMLGGEREGCCDICDGCIRSQSKSLGTVGQGAGNPSAHSLPRGFGTFTEIAGGHALGRVGGNAAGSWGSSGFVASQVVRIPTAAHAPPPVDVSSLQRAAAAASVLNERQCLHRNQAYVVLLALEEKCLSCGVASCNGEKCLNGACYICGGKNHRANNCTERSTTRLALAGIACYQCFDLHKRHGYQHHSVDKCPLQRRLRRLIFSRITNDTTLARVLGEIYSTQDTFFEFMSMFFPGE